MRVEVTVCVCELSLEHPHSVAVTHTPAIVSTSGVAKGVLCDRSAPQEAVVSIVNTQYAMYVLQYA